MASNREIAEMIPQKYRTEILLKNHFHKAEHIYDFGDRDVQMLWIYWSLLIEPENPQYAYKIINGEVIIEGQCKLCLATLKKKWAAILPHMIELEQEANLLDEIQ